MNYTKLLNTLKKDDAKRILVTGAHRSGTTFASLVLGSDLNILTYNEENIDGGNTRLLNRFQQWHKQYVLQAPGLSLNCHDFDFDAIVFMRRNYGDTARSMAILNNSVITNEYNRIKSRYNEYSEYNLPEAKYRIFTEVQMPLIKKPYILDYESLEGHPLWISEERRANWHIRQVSPT